MRGRLYARCQEIVKKAQEDVSVISVLCYNRAYRSRRERVVAMALNITIGAALILIVLLGVVGFRRDARRGVLALAGTLLGAIVVGFWAAQWGQALASRFVGGDAQRLTFIVSRLILVF